MSARNVRVKVTLDLAWEDAVFEPGPMPRCDDATHDAISNFVHQTLEDGDPGDPHDMIVVVDESVPIKVRDV